MPARIAIVTPVYPPYRGGMGAVAARDASQLKVRGFEVDVYTPDYSNRAKGAEATYLPYWFAFGNAACVPSLYKFLGEHDLAHLHYPFYGADIFVWLWSLLKKRPYVITYHMRAKTHDWRDFIFASHRWLLEPFIVRSARAVFVSSLDYAQSIGLRHKHLVELPFGVDEQRFSPGRDDEFRAQHGLPNSSFVFIFVGGLDRAHSFKGVDVLIRAAATLPQDQDWRLLIAGDGDLRTEYESLAAKLGLSDKLVFAGAIPEHDLPRAYRAADAHVLPSITRSEAFGLVTLEAAATGLPSLVSDLPGVRTLVVPGETGRVLEPKNEQTLAQAMGSLIASPDLAKSMGIKARARVLACYTSDTLADRLSQVYKDLISL